MGWFRWNANIFTAIAEIATATTLLPASFPPSQGFPILQCWLLWNAWNPLCPRSKFRFVNRTSIFQMTALSRLACQAPQICNLHSKDPPAWRLPYLSGVWQQHASGSSSAGLYLIWFTCSQMVTPPAKDLIQHGFHSNEPECCLSVCTTMYVLDGWVANSALLWHWHHQHPFQISEYDLWFKSNTTEMRVE